MAERTHRQDVSGLVTTAVIVGLVTAWAQVGWWLAACLLAGLDVAYYAWRRFGPYSYSFVWWEVGSWAVAIADGIFLPFELSEYVWKHYRKGVEQTLQAIVWAVFLGLEIVLGVTTHYWGFSAVLWYASGLAACRGVLLEWDVSKFRSGSYGRAAMMVICLTAGTAMLALLSMDNQVSLRRTLRFG